MGRRSTLQVGATLLVVLLVVGACSSTAALSGHGSVGTPTSAPLSGFPPASTPGAPTTSVPTTSVPTTSVPTTSVPTTAITSSSVPPTSGARQVCPLRSNPPFCYSLPAGFRDYTYLDTYGKGWQYRTLVSVGRRDLIEVLGTLFKVDTDGDSYAALQKYFDKQLRSRPGKYHVRRAGPVKRVRVDGARAFEQHMIFTDGVHGDTTTIFRGRAVVSLDCQSQTLAATVRTACSRVHHSLHIR